MHDPSKYYLARKRRFLLEFDLITRSAHSVIEGYFGENVRAVMGERDNQWITDQVMDIEVPEAMKPLRKAVSDLFSQVA